VCTRASEVSGLSRRSQLSRIKLRRGRLLTLQPVQRPHCTAVEGPHMSCHCQLWLSHSHWLLEAFRAAHHKPAGTSPRDVHQAQEALLHHQACFGAVTPRVPSRRQLTLRAWPAFVRGSPRMRSTRGTDSSSLAPARTAYTSIHNAVHCRAFHPCDWALRGTVDLIAKSIAAERRRAREGEGEEAGVH
jgi:hypothetical protein